MVQAPPVQKQRETEGPSVPPALCPEAALALAWCAHFCADAHCPVCVRRYTFTYGALGSCLTLSAAGLAHSQFGVGGSPEVFESRPLPPGHAHPSVTRVPCTYMPCGAQSPVLGGVFLRGLPPVSPFLPVGLHFLQAKSIFPLLVSDTGQ